MIRVIFIFGLLVALSVQQTGTSDCTGKSPGSSCRTSLCMKDQTCNSQGQCSGGSSVDCSYIAAGYSSCTFGLCDPIRGCVLAVHAAGTPCDTNGDYCDTELCSQTGDCIDYYTPVQCPQGQTCNPQTGQCAVPPSPSVSASQVPSVSTTGSPTATMTPSLSIGETPSASPVPSTQPSISPTNFVHLSESLTPSPSVRQRRNNSTLPVGGNATLTPSLVPFNDTRKHNSKKNRTTPAEIGVLVAGSVCFFFGCMLLLACGAFGRKRHIKQLVRSIRARKWKRGQGYEIQLDKTSSSSSDIESDGSQVEFARQSNGRTLLDDGSSDDDSDSDDHKPPPMSMHEETLDEGIIKALKDGAGGAPGLDVAAAADQPDAF